MPTKQEASDFGLDDLKALEAILKTLAPLPEDERARVLRWTAEKLSIHVGVGGRSESKSSHAASSMDSVFAKNPGGFQTIGEFLAAASPDSDVDRVLCVAVYLQDLKDSPPDATLSGKQINDELKDLGHGVKNITDCINSLKGRKPQHMIQTKKAGKSKQAWKEYRVTKAGIEHVYRLINEGADEAQKGLQS